MKGTVTEMRLAQSLSQNPPKTRLSIIAPGFLHSETESYDLARLRSLIVELAPDLLLAEIAPDDWESGDLSNAPIEVKEALVPAAAVTNIVLVPVAPTIYQISEYITDYEGAAENYAKALAGNILQAVRRDPGVRVLAVVQQKWLNALERILKRKEGSLDIVDHTNL